MVKKSMLMKPLEPEPAPLPLFPPNSGTPHARLQHLGPNTLQPPSSALPAGLTAKPEQPDYESSRILYNSVNYFSGNPDAFKRRILACSCGSPIHIDRDWYTEIFDGTVLCWQCASCCRCGISGMGATRRLVSIGGYVLCYLCIQHYGEPRVKTLRLQIVQHAGKRNSRRLRRLAETAGDVASGGNAGGHNTGSMYTNLWKTRRSPDRRPILRYRAYPRPKCLVPAPLDPAEQPQGFYAATRSPFAERMVCPSCKLPVTGRRAQPCVAPAISAVYHRACYCCVTCRWPLSVGYREPGKHYVFCTCVPPMLWCNRPGCQRERKDHHATFKCRLEPIHPGGRGQSDFLDLPGALQRQPKTRTSELLMDSSKETPLPAAVASPLEAGVTPHQLKQPQATAGKTAATKA